MPLFQNDLWVEDVVPEVIVHDFNEKAAGFLNCLTRVIGLTKGHTILPTTNDISKLNLDDPSHRKEVGTETLNPGIMLNPNLEPDAEA